MDALPSSTFDIAVIGAGFSGAGVCYALQENSCRKSVVVLDQKSVAAGASGNPRAHMIPYVTSPAFIGHDFYNAGFASTEALLKKLSERGMLSSLHETPAVQFAANDRPARLIEKVSKGVLHHQVSPVDAQSFQGFFGPSIDRPVEPFVMYPITFSVDPRQLCRSMIAYHENVEVKENSEVSSIHVDSQSKHFLLQVNGEIIAAHTVIVTAGHESIKFCELPIKALRGQVVTGIPHRALTDVRVPLCYNGYYLPPNRESPHAFLGTTYDRNDTSIEPNHQKNVGMLDRLLALPIFRASNLQEPSKANQDWFSFLESRVSFRATTPDRLPMVGQLGDGLFICAGHGSRGLHSAPLGSALIVKKILNSVEKEDQAFLSLLDPLRKSSVHPRHPVVD